MEGDVSCEMRWLSHDRLLHLRLVSFRLVLFVFGPSGCGYMGGRRLEKTRAGGMSKSADLKPLLDAVMTRQRCPPIPHRTHS